jgi:hypothetical protein
VAEGEGEMVCIEFCFMRFLFSIRRDAMRFDAFHSPLLVFFILRIINSYMHTFRLTRSFILHATRFDAFPSFHHIIYHLSFHTNIPILPAPATSAPGQVQVQQQQQSPTTAEQEQEAYKIATEEVHSRLSKAFDLGEGGNANHEAAFKLLSGAIAGVLLKGKSGSGGGSEVSWFY